MPPWHMSDRRSLTPWVGLLVAGVVFAGTGPVHGAAPPGVAAGVGHAVTAVTAGTVGTVGGAADAAIEVSAAARKAPGVRRLAPGKLRRARNARIPFLQDGWVDAGGTRFRTRLPRQRHQVLLGRSGNGWLVANGRKGRLQVHRVRPGRAPVLVPGSRLHGGLISVRVSRDGAHLVSADFERESSTYEVRRVSDGQRVDLHVTSTQVGEVPFDAADGHVLMLREAGDLPPREEYAADWEVGGEDRRLGSGMIAGFLRRDTAFVAAPEGTRRYGPTSISTPGEPAWSARFAPLAISPDRRLVLGTGPRLVHRRQVLQVRRMSDGKVLRQYSYGRVIRPREFWSFDGDTAQTARFEGNRRFVFELAAGGRARLVRCTMAGRCVQASRTGGGVSTTYERFRWLL